MAIGPHARPDEASSENILRMLRDKDWSIQDLRRRARLPWATTYRAAMGIGSPALYTLRAVKAALGCTWDELLGP